MSRPRRLLRRVGLLLVAAAVLPGCVHVRRGIWCALADSTDIVRADVSFSLGTDMGAHVMATKWLQLKSYSYEDLYRVGIGARHFGIWEESRQDWWLGPTHAKCLSMNSQFLAAVGYGLFPKMCSGKWAPLTYLAESSDEIGVGAHLFVAGFRVGVRPAEIADLFANVVGQDLCGDNVLRPRLRFYHKWGDGKPEEEEEQPPARETEASTAAPPQAAVERLERMANQIERRAEDIRRRAGTQSP